MKVELGARVCPYTQAQTPSRAGGRYSLSLAQQGQNYEKISLEEQKFHFLSLRDIGKVLRPCGAAAGKQVYMKDGEPLSLAYISKPLSNEAEQVKYQLIL